MSPLNIKKINSHNNLPKYSTLKQSGNSPVKNSNLPNENGNLHNESINLPNKMPAYSNMDFQMNHNNQFDNTNIQSIPGKRRDVDTYEKAEVSMDVNNFLEPTMVKERQELVDKYIQERIGDKTFYNTLVDEELNKIRQKLEPG